MLIVQDCSTCIHMINKVYAGIYSSCCTGYCDKHKNITGGSGFCLDWQMEEFKGTVYSSNTKAIKE